MYKPNAEFGLQLLKEAFPTGKMPSPPWLSTTTRTAVEVSYGSCSAEHVARDLPSLSPSLPPALYKYTDCPRVSPFVLDVHSLLF